MSPFDSSASSPCKGCKHSHQDKKKFKECINCEKRFGGNTRFLPERSKKGGGGTKLVPEKDCAWPHNCPEKATKSDYCYYHQQIIQGRRRRYLKKGLTEEQMADLLVAPVYGGLKRNPLG